MGARPYTFFNHYKPARGCLIEIGSERGEGSTGWLADYANRRGLEFHTADIDPDRFTAASRVTDNAHLMPGRDMIHGLDRPISAAYMDGFDWIPRDLEMAPWIMDQRARYYQLGDELSNERCQTVHLDEAKALARQATRKCVVIYDDTWLEDDKWTGKGGMSVPYLIRKGFEVRDHGPCGEQSLGYAVLVRE